MIWNGRGGERLNAAMANPIQQGLKPQGERTGRPGGSAAMANPIQQGLKPDSCGDERC